MKRKNKAKKKYKDGISRLLFERWVNALGNAIGKLKDGTAVHHSSSQFHYASILWLLFLFFNIVGNNWQVMMK